MSRENLLEQVLSSVESKTKKFGNFLSVQNDVAKELKYSIKDLYDFTKCKSNRKNDALPELVIQDFDEEQIWQQLELHNKGELTYFLLEVSKTLAGKKKLDLPVRTLKNGEIVEASEAESEAKSEPKSPAKIRQDRKVAKTKKRTKSRLTKPSVVDDKFFKLEELDEYLTREDKKETEGAVDPVDSDEEEPVDLFAESDENEDENENDSGDDKMTKYAGFFDSPDSEEETNEKSHKRKSSEYENEGDGDGTDDGAEDDEADEEMEESLNEPESKVKKVKFNLTNDSDETDSLEERRDGKGLESFGKSEGNEEKSSLENRDERLQRRIEQLEKEAISEKPWQLKGEVAAADRPQNSLLEEFVEFDVLSRPAPVITEQVTFKLEDLIRQRIKDRAWDDVVRKFKPVETPLEYKKKLVMDQEKSKKSLAQIYEDAFVKQRDAANPEENEREAEEPNEHKEIRNAMNSLFKKLDSLSNFHYTPKQAQPEIKIVSNLPAINMEEVAPIATTDATLLAPEEIQARPRGEMLGRSERSSTDKKRERRKKKMLQRSHQKRLQSGNGKGKSLIEKLKPGGKKYTKGEAAEVIKKLTKDRNIVKMDETSNKVAKSSTAFFAQLHDQVKNHVRTAGKTSALKKKDKRAFSAIKLKM